MTEKEMKQEDQVFEQELSQPELESVSGGSWDCPSVTVRPCPNNSLRTALNMSTDDSDLTKSNEQLTAETDE